MSAEDPKETLKNLIYDDDFSYGLLGLHGYEGWSSSVNKVYEFISAIGASSEYPSYNPAICWAGYVDVVNRKQRVSITML